MIYLHLCTSFTKIVFPPGGRRRLHDSQTAQAHPYFLPCERYARKDRPSISFVLEDIFPFSDAPTHSTICLGKALCCARAPTRSVVIPLVKPTVSRDTHHIDGERSPPNTKLISETTLQVRPCRQTFTHVSAVTCLAKTRQACTRGPPVGVEFWEQQKVKYCQDIEVVRNSQFSESVLHHENRKQMTGCPFVAPRAESCVAYIGRHDVYL
jgi:hypothetical protein